MNKKRKEVCKRMENDEFDGELDEKEMMLEQIKFSTLPLLYMFVDIQKKIEF